jgi:hypothetical protein
MIRNQSKYINNEGEGYTILYNELQTFKLENLLYTTCTNCFLLVLAHQPINTCLSIISTNTTVFLFVAYLWLVCRKRLLRTPSNGHIQWSTSCCWASRISHESMKNQNTDSWLFCVKNRLTFSTSVSCEFYTCFTELVHSVFCFWFHSHFSMMREQLPYRAEVMSDIRVPTHEHLNWYPSFFGWYFLFLSSYTKRVTPLFLSSAIIPHVAIAVCVALHRLQDCPLFPHYICEINALHINYYFKASSYITENTLHLHYKDQLANAIKGNNYCLPWELYESHKYTLWVKCRISYCALKGCLGS